MEDQISKILIWTITQPLPLSSGLRVLKIACIVALQSKLQHTYWTTCLHLEIGGSVVFHAHANSLSHQTSPTHLHTHCRSIKISRNSAPQHTWSSSISMPDLPHFPSPWAVQLQQVRCIFGPSTGTAKLVGRSTGKVAGYTGSITNFSCSLISQLLSHPFSNRWCARLQSDILEVLLLYLYGT